MAFKNTDLSNLTPNHQNGSVTTAGVPVSITAPSSNVIQQFYIQNPSKGPNSNGPNDYLRVSIDNTTNYITLNRGESMSFQGDTSTVKVDASSNGVKYEAIVWYAS